MTAELVLVCDPDLRMRRALGVILRGAGYAVPSTATAGEALEIELPDLDGIELCRRLRHAGDMAIVVLSAVDADSVIIHALRCGADTT